MCFLDCLDVSCSDGGELALLLLDRFDISFFVQLPLAPFLINLALFIACSAAGIAQYHRDRATNSKVDQQVRELVKRYFEGDAVQYKTTFTQGSPPLGARVYRAIWVAGSAPADGLRIGAMGASRAIGGPPLSQKPPPAKAGFSRSGKKPDGLLSKSMI